MNKYKYSIGEYAFCLFRGKWRLGKIEFIKSKGLGVKYELSIAGAKRFQEKGEEELKKCPKINI